MQQTLMIRMVTALWRYYNELNAGILRLPHIDASSYPTWIYDNDVVGFVFQQFVQGPFADITDRFESA